MISINWQAAIEVQFSLLCKHFTYSNFEKGLYNRNINQYIGYFLLLLLFYENKGSNANDIYH